MTDIIPEELKSKFLLEQLDKVQAELFSSKEDVRHKEYTLKDSPLWQKQLTRTNDQRFIAQCCEIVALLNTTSVVREQSMIVKARDVFDEIDWNKLTQESLEKNFLKDERPIEAIVDALKLGLTIGDLCTRIITKLIEVGILENNTDIDS